MSTTQNSPNRSLWGRSVLALSLVALLILGIWVYAKCLLFDQLEYTSDIFQSLIVSRSVFQGLGLFWEPQYGGLTHNFALLPTWYVLTSWLGAYGLFAGHALLMLAVIAGFASEINLSEAWRRESYWLVVFALVLGPVGFWLWDDPTYGWHTELAFLPLSILFAMGLTRRSRVAWLWGAMLIANREEGALIAWAVHALFVLMEAGPNLGGTADRCRRRRTARLALLTLAYLVVFAANVALLLARQPNAADSRIGTALARVPTLWANLAWRTEVWRSVGDAFGLWLAGAIVAVAILRVRWVLLVALVTIPLVVVEAFGMLAYDVGDMRYHGIGWPPRFAMLWGPLVVGSVYAIKFAAAPRLGTRRARVAVCVVAAAISVYLQASVLGASRDYDMVARLESVVGHGPQLGASALTAREDRAMRCLGARLPYDTRVAVPAFLDAWFHRQRLLMGQASAQFVVCDRARPSRWAIATPCAPARSLVWATRAVIVDQLFVAFSPGLLPLLEPCVAGTTVTSTDELEFSDEGAETTREPADATASARVSVTVTGAGTGHVLRTARRSCSRGTCDTSYPLDTAIELSAVPDLGSLFAGWAGDCNSPNLAVRLSLNASKSCTASFEPAPAATKLSPADGATVTDKPVLLRWQPVASAHYFVCVSQAPITAKCDTRFRDATASQLEQAGLAPGVYFWQVRVSYPAGRFDLDGVSWSFTVPLPSRSPWNPSLIGPLIVALLTLGAWLARRQARGARTL